MKEQLHLVWDPGESFCVTCRDDQILERDTVNITCFGRRCFFFLEEYVSLQVWAPKSSHIFLLGYFFFKKERDWNASIWRPLTFGRSWISIWQRVDGIWKNMKGSPRDVRVRKALVKALVVPLARPRMSRGLEFHVELMGSFFLVNIWCTCLGIHIPFKHSSSLMIGMAGSHVVDGCIPLRKGSMGKG